MAGIGFELRKIMKRDTLTGVARAYAYVGLISSEPLILSIFGILIICVISLACLCSSCHANYLRRADYLG